jgi:hypothetical protein
MGRLRCSEYGLILAVLTLLDIAGCGGHKPAGTSPYPAKITLTPNTATSLQLGSVITFTASAQNGTGNNVSTTFTYISSDTTVLNISPAGAACAGQWNVTYTVCSPGNVGVVYVTANAAIPGSPIGINSAPTIIFVHQPIDQIVVSGFLPLNSYVQEPCMSQGQTMPVQALAFAEGTDITSSVGPFTWSANNSAVATIAPTVSNFTYKVPTNQAIVTAGAPGITQIYASASGVTSTAFQQPQYTNSTGTLSPLLDFFESCPIQSIMLEVGSGSQLTGQTSFVATKGTSETITAIVTDVMGNTSLAGSDTPVLISNTPLTWVSSQPAVVTVPSGCTLSCTLSTPLPGAASIMASCSPPTCNVGYPYIPPSLATPSALAACAAFFALPASTPSCQQFIPVPVYSSPYCPAALTGGTCTPTSSTASPLAPIISGLVTGATTSATVLATSTGCENVNPIDCQTSVYNISTAKAVAGSENPLPSSPTSLSFDLAGDVAYMGSEIQAVSLNPGNLGSSTGAFGTFGTVTGKVIGISNQGNTAVFSDTTLNPNQVFVVNTPVVATTTTGTGTGSGSGSGSGSGTTTSTGTPTVTAYPIQDATTAGFTPDGLKAFIFGKDDNGNPNLYVYSTVQGLQIIPLAAGTSVSSIISSNNGAFVYVVETSDPTLPAGGPGFRVYNTCQLTPGIATTPPASLGGPPTPVPQIIPLSATPVSFKALPDGIHFISMESGGGFDYITAAVTGIPPASIADPAASLCPSFVNNTVQSLSLEQGPIQPLDFFMSPDSSLMYVAANARSEILVYDFATGSTTGIPLVNNAVPVQVGMSADGGTIAVGGNDGYVHVVQTLLGGGDILQIPIPNLPNYYNPYCTFTPANGPCSFNLMAVRP